MDPDPVSTFLGMVDILSVDYDPRSISDANQDISENNQNNLRSSQAPIIPSQSQVLNNADLLQSILSFFHIPSNGTSRIPFPDSQHLLWASLTSRTFFDPAMNVLWRSMDSWLPLLQLIPTLTRKRNIYTMAGVILEQDLQRLHIYGRRIRRLDLWPLMQLVSPYIYTHISQLRHPHLFPALKELIIPDIGKIAAENLPGLFLTPSPSLSELSIGAIAPSTEGIAASLLQNAYMKSQNLRELALAGRFTIGSLSLVNQFSNLVTLRIDCRDTALPGDTLEWFSGLISLKDLHITLDDQSSLIPPTSPIPCFEALHSLGISASASQVSVILQNMDAQYLKKIRVHLTSLGHGASQEVLGQCIQRISLMTSATQALKAIHITSGDALVRIPETELKWLPMRTQIVHIDMTLDLNSNRLIPRLIKAASGETWQSIETLTLRSGLPRWSFVLSIGRLLPSLVFFPNLKYLTASLAIRMDAVTAERMREAVQSQVVCHNLQELTLLPFEDSTKVLANRDTATLENAFVLARYVNHFCPHLINLDLSRITSIRSDWRKGVEVMVRGLQEAKDKVHVC